MHTLTEIELQQIAPSVFAHIQSPNCSNRYTHIPTIESVRALKKAGYYPVKAQEVKARNPEKLGFSRHLLRFRHESSNMTDELVPEIVLLNSHDGTSSYQLRAGVYRFVCSNGLIVGNDTFCERIRHTGDAIEHVVQGADRLLKMLPNVVESADKWKQISLAYPHQLAFATAAARLKWKEADQPISSSALLSARRPYDTGQDLWTTFNVIQENLIKGRIRHRKGRTRGVTSVSENARLNTALWTLAEEMSKLANK